MKLYCSFLKAETMLYTLDRREIDESKISLEWYLKLAKEKVKFVLVGDKYQPEIVGKPELTKKLLASIHKKNIRRVRIFGSLDGIDKLCYIIKKGIYEPLLTAEEREALHQLFHDRVGQHSEFFIRRSSHPKCSRMVQYRAVFDTLGTAACSGVGRSMKEAKARALVHYFQKNQHLLKKEQDDSTVVQKQKMTIRNLM